MAEIGALDWLIWVGFFFITLTILYFVKLFQKQKANAYLIPGFLLKSLGGLSFALVYLFYYGGGDTTEYFAASKQMTEILASHPDKYVELMFSNCEQAQLILRSIGRYMEFSKSPEEWFMVRLISPFNLLTFNSFLGLTFLMSVLSFFGSMRLMKTMGKLLKNQERLLFVVNFMVPSVLFWGSGLLKDTVSFVGFAFIISLFYKIYAERKEWRMNVVKIVAIGYLVYILKAYVVFSIAPWVFVVLFFNVLKSIKTPILKVFMIPVLCTIVLSVAYFSILFLLDSSESYKSDTLISNVAGFHSWHTVLGGSVYNLGEIEYTVQGFAAKFPEAVNVTLFRPYPWEAKNPIVLLSSLESSLYLVFVVFLIILCGKRFFYFLFKNPFIFGAFVFSLLFAFSIGLTSYNFGALSRFKIPIVPIISFILIYIFVKNNQYKRYLKRKSQKNSATLLPSVSKKAMKL